jgi:hypothetical protein
LHFESPVQSRAFIRIQTPDAILFSPTYQAAILAYELHHRLRAFESDEPRPVVSEALMTAHHSQ